MMVRDNCQNLTDACNQKIDLAGVHHEGWKPILNESIQLFL